MWVGFLFCPHPLQIKMRMRMKKRVIFLIVCFWIAATARGYDFDANDFAREVVSYLAGEGASYYIFPQSALGRPSVDTDYYGAARPVVPVYPEWRAGQIVTIGVGGHLILKFNHKVSDDENNPYRIDFIVFGNAMAALGFENTWVYGDPSSTFIRSGQVNCEYGKVSVSQDGIVWYSFEGGPWGDSFAPILGRVFDPNNPCDVYPGWDNFWWGEVTNPTLPMEPNIEPNDFFGSSVAEMCMAYGQSAGGTGFDLRWLADFELLSVDENGRRWIQYIKVECMSVDTEGPLPEVDAVSDVGCCGDYKRPFIPGDINKDCRIDYEDLAIVAYYWMSEVNEQNCGGQSADIYKDGVIDFFDFAVLGESWLVESGK